MAGDGTVTASCCNKAAGTSEVHSTTNVATASCGAANLVGGGGYCDDPTAKITFSHPLPYATGSTPTQWTVRCSKNGVWAVAKCSIQDAYDSCRVQRTVNASGKIASADCFSNEVATSTGVWCGSGSFSGGNFSSNMNTITVGCSQNDTHAFAICCDGAGP